MPSFSECCGKDEYVCQKCGSIKCCQCFPPSWNVIKGVNGNVCPSCLSEYTSWELKHIHKAIHPTGKCTYTISVEHIRELKPRDNCPFCASKFASKDMIEHDMKHWIFKCPRCSTKIVVKNY
jgi:DNA-directed RNA polymerase subunit RPC12/RpoP